MRNYHFIKYSIELELIMNDKKQKWVSDILEIELQLSFKEKKSKQNTNATTTKATHIPNPKDKLWYMKHKN